MKSQKEVVTSFLAPITLCAPWYSLGGMSKRGLKEMNDYMNIWCF